MTAPTHHKVYTAQLSNVATSLSTYLRENGLASGLVIDFTLSLGLFPDIYPYILAIL